MRRSRLEDSDRCRKTITNLTPWDHKCLFKRVSMRTSGVPICFSANFLISLTARGARRLKPLEFEGKKRKISINKPSSRQFTHKWTKAVNKSIQTYTPWIRLCKLIVYSLVTISLVTSFFLPSLFLLAISRVVLVSSSSKKIEYRQLNSERSQRIDATNEKNRKHHVAMAIYEQT